MGDSIVTKKYLVYGKYLVNKDFISKLGLVIGSSVN